MSGFDHPGILKHSLGATGQVPTPSVEQDEPDVSKCACVHALSTIAAAPLEAHRLEMEARVLGQYGDTLSHEEFLELTRGELIRSLNVDADDGKCTKATFALAMLVTVWNSTTGLGGPDQTSIL